jgi:phosphoglycolate phosphatase-like HAD superfamily hydrolase
MGVPIPGGGVMRFAGYIFDVEGTLVDSVQQNLLSLQEALADFGIGVLCVPKTYPSLLSEESAKLAR